MALYGDGLGKWLARLSADRVVVGSFHNWGIKDINPGRSSLNSVLEKITGSNICMISTSVGSDVYSNAGFVPSMKGPLNDNL